LCQVITIIFHCRAVVHYDRQLSLFKNGAKSVRQCWEHSRLHKLKKYRLVSDSFNALNWVHRICMLLTLLQLKKLWVYLHVRRSLTDNSRPSLDLQKALAKLFALNFTHGSSFKMSTTCIVWRKLLRTSWLIRHILSFLGDRST